MEHVPDPDGENERWDYAPRLGAAIPDSLGYVAPDSLTCYRCEFPYAGKMAVEMAARGKLERVFSLGPLALGIVARTGPDDLPWMRRHKLWHTHRLPHFQDAAKPATKRPEPVPPWEPEASASSGASRGIVETATEGPREKSTHSTRTLSLPVNNEKAPTDIFHGVECPPSVPVSGVGFSGSVVGDDVRSLLVCRGFVVWSSPCRVSGLMALASFIASSIKKSEGGKKHGVPCSNRLALQYCSKLRSAPDGTPLQPLAVLLRIGVLELVKPAKVNFGSKSSARYRIAKKYQGVSWVSADDKTNHCMKRKLANATARREAGLNRRWPFRALLKRDLAQVSIPDSARPVVAELLADHNKRPSTLNVVTSISTREHTVEVDPVLRPARGGVKLWCSQAGVVIC